MFIICERTMTAVFVKLTDMTNTSLKSGMSNSILMVGHLQNSTLVPGHVKMNTINSRYIEAGYNEIPAYSEM